MNTIKLTEYLPIINSIQKLCRQAPGKVNPLSFDRETRAAFTQVYGKSISEFKRHIINRLEYKTLLNRKEPV